MSVAAAAERVELAGSGFELGFIDGAGSERRSPLAACAGVRFEDGLPVRQFRWSRGLGHFPGWWWAATTGRHVGYESWLERDHVRALDFDPDIAGIASQPFWLYWTGERGRRRHAPDYFARRADTAQFSVEAIRKLGAEPEQMPGPLTADGVKAALGKAPPTPVPFGSTECTARTPREF